MGISSTEIIITRPAALGGEARNNGGRMSPVPLDSGIKNNLFPDVSVAERMTGLTTWRKFYWHVRNDRNLALISAEARLTVTSPNDGYVLLYQGTQEDVEADLTGNERAYGVVKTTPHLQAGAASLFLPVNDELHAKAFQSGDSIWLDDGVNEEQHDNVTVVNLFPVLLLELENGDALEHAFPNGCTVASVLRYGDVACSLSDWHITNDSTATYDLANYPLELSNLGTVFDRWTITFLSPTEFYATGEYSGVKRLGTIGEDYAPGNQKFNRPFFNLKAAGWKGAWRQGDNVTFTTTPASVPLWLKRVILPGAKAQELDGTAFILSGVYTA